MKNLKGFRWFKLVSFTILLSLAILIPAVAFASDVDSDEDGEGDDPQLVCTLKFELIGQGLTDARASEELAEALQSEPVAGYIAAHQNEESFELMYDWVQLRSGDYKQRARIEECKVIETADAADETPDTEQASETTAPLAPHAAL